MSRKPVHYCDKPGCNKEAPVRTPVATTVTPNRIRVLIYGDVCDDCLAADLQAYTQQLGSQPHEQ